MLVRVSAEVTKEKLFNSEYLSSDIIMLNKQGININTNSVHFIIIYRYYDFRLDSQSCKNMLTLQLQLMFFILVIVIGLSSHVTYPKPTYPVPVYHLT